jgi:hypothetical protein
MTSCSTAELRFDSELMQIPGQLGLGALWPPVISQRLHNSKSPLCLPIHTGASPLGPLQGLGCLVEAGGQSIDLPNGVPLGGFMR